MAALALLAENIAHLGRQYWTDSVGVPPAVKPLEPALQGYRQVTDAYLLALAARHNGVLATCSIAASPLSPVTRSAVRSSWFPRGGPDAYRRAAT